ncbi:RnfH family protein [Thiomonas sp. FB-6]|uniref:RnfH family protein n=1 Tax=Thiomonas sp. FB-6 TaxID=1158291 RepID=UPI0003615CAA|nr:RnfH family protein [Thiomonas sp. FB-6]
MSGAGPTLRCSVFWSDGAGGDVLRELELPAGATLADAVLASGIAALLPDAGWREPAGALRLAVWGRLREAGEALHDGDRVDLTRPLRIDPKEARRLRARGADRRRAARGASRPRDRDPQAG